MKFMENRWLILGAGGHGLSVADAIKVNGDTIIGFLDDRNTPGDLIGSIPVLGSLSLVFELEQIPLLANQQPPNIFVVAIGDPFYRQIWQDSLELVGAPLGVVIHPRACISASARLEPGCVVLACAVVNANAHLSRGVILNSGSVVDHDAICGAFSQLGVNAAMAGASRLGELALLAAGEALGCKEAR